MELDPSKNHGNKNPTSGKLCEGPEPVLPRRDIRLKEASGTSATFLSFTYCVQINKSSTVAL